MSLIRILADEQGETFTEAEREVALTFGIDIDLGAVEPGTIVEAQIDPEGRAHYNHPLSKGYNPWLSYAGDFEVIEDYETEGQ